MALFEEKAPWIMGLLRRDFGISVEDAAAVLGNLGHECAGFTDLIEFESRDGGRGGIGWPQWTGPRRRAYEAYCNRNGYNKFSDMANYKYLYIELAGLEGSEGTALAKTKAASGLYNKTVAFEKGFERAGVKHYDRRYAYAQRAMKAYPNWDGSYPDWVASAPPASEDDLVPPPSSVAREIILFLERLIVWLRKSVKD